MSRTLSLIVLSIVLPGCVDAVVGLRCAEGFEARNGRCDSIDGLYDAGEDGEAGDGATGDSETAEGGTSDAGFIDGGKVDGGDGGDGDGGPDATSDGGDSGTADTGTDAGDGSVVACEVGELECDGVCVDPDSDPAHCGGCGASCASGEVCALGACAPVCEAPLAFCDGRCVDTTSDANHCGACGNRCASGLCADSMCISETAGHVVAVGHDYRQGRLGMNRIAGNAIFLAGGAPVRVLTYVGSADPRSVAGVDRAIAQVARERGRSWSRTTARANEVTLRLEDADAFVVYPQSAETEEGLAVLRARWSAALSTFLRGGGVVVVFEGGGAHRGTHRVLTDALFSAHGRAAVTLGTVDLVAPADAVAPGVPLTYRAEQNTFVFHSPSGIVVAEHEDGPVVVHHVVTFESR